MEKLFTKPAHIEMNRFLLNIKYTHNIKPHPVDIEVSGKLNATQLRSFLLYIALPFVVRFLPTHYQC